jgi:hypothetical protein
MECAASDGKPGDLVHVSGESAELLLSSVRGRFHGNRHHWL